MLELVFQKMHLKINHLLVSLCKISQNLRGQTDFHIFHTIIEDKNATGDFVATD